MQNELTLVDEMEQAQKECYTSLNLETEATRKMLFKISESADGRVSDNLNKTIMLKDLFLQRYKKVNEETGELEVKTRTILIDKDGKSYASASRGLYNSILRFMSIMGKPDEWESPIAIEIQEVQLPKGKTYKIVPVTK